MLKACAAAFDAQRNNIYHSTQQHLQQLCLRVHAMQRDRRQQYSALCAIVLQQDMPLLASGGLHSTIDFSNTLTITHHRILRGCMETTTPQAIHGRYHCRACV
jgi:hypothetical protein